MTVPIYIRGQADPFGMFDETPVWIPYTAPVQQPWRYVQVSLGEPGGAWSPPIGIPMPPFGITEEAPALPDPWTSDVAGFYYVNEQTGTDTARTYGNPNAPRYSIPTNLAAGSVVILTGTVYKDYSTASLHLNGTAVAPVFIRGLSQAERPTATRKWTVYGSYGIVENIYFHWANSSSNGKLEVFGNDHLVVRHCELHGDTGGGIGRLMLWGQYHVFWDNYHHDVGDVNSSVDQDAHGYSLGSDTSYIWILDNEICRCSGDGLQINGSVTTTHHIYFGRNISHHNKQTGCWSKQASDVIFSQNTIYGHRPGNSSDGAGTGMQYGPDYVWFIFNHLYDNCSGVRSQSDSGMGVADPHIYVIGNLIHDVVEIAGMDNASTDATAAVSFRGGTYRYVVGNTIWDYPRGIYEGPARGVCHIENNIMGGRTQPLGREILMCTVASLPGSASNVRNNVFPASGRYQAQNGTVHTSVASFDAVVGTVSGNIETDDPGFVSVSTPSLPTDDFSLRADSVALDAALNTTDLSVDVYDVFYQRYGISIRKDRVGVTLPENGLNDIAAYQR